MLVTPGCLVRFFFFNDRSTVVASSIYLVSGQSIRFFQRVVRKKPEYL